MPWNETLNLEPRPAGFQDYEQWLTQAREAESGTGAGFVVGFRGSEVVAWNLRDAQGDVQTLAGAALQDSVTHAEFAVAQDRFLSSIAQSRHQFRVPWAKCTLYDDRRRGIPLTSRRILEVAAILAEKESSEHRCDHGDAGHPAMDTASPGNQPGSRHYQSPNEACPVTGPGSECETQVPDNPLAEAVEHASELRRTPLPSRGYQRPWRLFERWCNDQRLPAWPASDKTVARFLRAKASSCSMHTLERLRNCISNTHRTAWLPDPTTSQAVRQTLCSLGDTAADRERLRSNLQRSAGTDALAAVRATTPRSRSIETTEQAQHRRLKDRVLYALIVEARLSRQQVAALKWPALTTLDDGDPAVALRTQPGGTETCIVISRELACDIETLSRFETMNGRMFPLSNSEFNSRLRCIERAARAERSHNGKQPAGNPTPMTSDPGAPSPTSTIGAPTEPMEGTVHDRPSGEQPTMPTGNGTARPGIPDPMEAGGTGNVPKTDWSTGFARAWHAFCNWCKEQGSPQLPTTTETVVTYIRVKAKRIQTKNIATTIAAISRRHRAAGHDDPCSSPLVTTEMRDLRMATTQFRHVSLDDATMGAIRATALERRLRGRNRESSQTAKARGLLDIALCSLIHATGMSAPQAATLTWQEVRQSHGNGIEVTTTRKDRRGRSHIETHRLNARVADDLNAIRHGAGQDQKVFGMTGRALRQRFDAAVLRAGHGPPAPPGAEVAGNTRATACGSRVSSTPTPERAGVRQH